jgi:hypothetical protein
MLGMPNMPPTILKHKPTPTYRRAAGSDAGLYTRPTAAPKQQQHQTTAAHKQQNCHASAAYRCHGRAHTKANLFHCFTAPRIPCLGANYTFAGTGNNAETDNCSRNPVFVVEPVISQMQTNLMKQLTRYMQCVP